MILNATWNAAFRRHHMGRLLHRILAHIWLAVAQRRVSSWFRSIVMKSLFSNSLCYLHCNGGNRLIYMPDVPCWI